MKTIILLLTFLFCDTICFSQKEFTLKSSVGKQSLKVNGHLFLIDSIESKISTNYPKFDTLIFIENAPNAEMKIVCNFKPDSVYVISRACCGSLDIIPASKLINDSLGIWDPEFDFAKIQNVSMDKPFISLRTKQNPKDSIYAWHSDAACMTQHKTINKELWRLGVPPKCFYWSNITSFLFFRIDQNMPTHEDTFLEEFLGMKNIVELNSITFRLFDDEKFIIIYDERRNRATLQYE